MGVLAENDPALAAMAEESDDDFAYEEVDVLRCVLREAPCTGHACFSLAHCSTHLRLQTAADPGSDEEDDGVSEDLDAALRSLQALTTKVSS
jgi:hypothetical protein